MKLFLAEYQQLSQTISENLKLQVSKPILVLSQETLARADDVVVSFQRRYSKRLYLVKPPDTIRYPAAGGCQCSTACSPRI
jgi:hypothetical protein